MTISTLMLGGALAFAQGVAADEDPGDVAVFEESSASQGQLDAQSEPLQIQPLLVGLGAGFLPGTLCICLGAGGCIGAAVYYRNSSPPYPQGPMAGDPGYMQSYSAEMKKRRMRWAIIGGTAGVVAAAGVNLAINYVLDPWGIY
ncbi:MAG: hypothetical protein H6741_19210 [Alphaproteobacteria bacterium]|nr:hypothetical protein [Alphaproteobacteria bacterium]